MFMYRTLWGRELNAILLVVSTEKVLISHDTEILVIKNTVYYMKPVHIICRFVWLR